MNDRDRDAEATVPLDQPGSGDVALDVTMAASPGGTAAVTTGQRIGRFVVLDRLGEGAMGIVVAAYDPALDRKVAIKVIKPAAMGLVAGTERLLREARAMAKLTHPQVLAVHEVGEIDDQIFVAVEFAAGGTLRAWTAAAPRSWREVLDRFVLAARGLSAAHQAGLIHRDFKPDNVLLTAAGEIRVADFGLVGIHGRESVSSDPERERATLDASLDLTLTRTGAVLGTPAYMAPEQHERRTAEPASDQFAFCVALWEALYRQRPFAGASYAELAANVIAGRIVEVSAQRGVPAWLHAAVRRGLSVVPADRWPSMAALVDALTNDPSAVRRRRLVLGVAIAGATTLAGLAILALSGRSASAPPGPCHAMDARLDGVWDPKRSAGVRAAFDASGRASADQTFERVDARLRAYTEDWVATRVEVCEATRVRGEQSDTLMDLRMACLDHRLADLDALVGVLSRDVTAGVVDKAVEAASRLPSLDLCDDAEALQATVPAPADAATRSAVDTQRQALARAKALEDAGRYKDALTAVQAVAAEAERIGYAPLLAASLFRRASLEAKLEPKSAERTLEQAILAAADAHDDAVAAWSWAELVMVLGNRLGRPDDALRLQPVAEAAVRRAGRDPVIEARLLNNLGTVTYVQGRYTESQQYIERSFALREQALGPDHIDVAASLNNLGNLARATARYPQAEQHLRRALAIWEHALGGDHPLVATGLNNLGTVQVAQGAYEQARANVERSVAIREQALGADTIDVAESLSLLGRVLTQLGEYGEAREAAHRALAIRERAFGVDHPRVATTVNVIGVAWLAESRFAEARPWFERALAIWQAAGDSAAATAECNLGAVLDATGHHAEARQHYQRALSVSEASVGADHPDVAEALRGLASALVALDEPADAVAAATRATRILEAISGAPEDLAASRFVLARARWAADDDRPAAIALARRARDDLAAAGAAGARHLAMAEAWLRSHAR